jgi:hypothetical protein
MSISNEQLQLIERLLNLPGVGVLDVDIIDERIAGSIYIFVRSDSVACIGMIGLR